METDSVLKTDSVIFQRPAVDRELVKNESDHFFFVFVQPRCSLSVTALLCVPLFCLFVLFVLIVCFVLFVCLFVCLRYPSQRTACVRLEHMDALSTVLSKRCVGGHFLAFVAELC